MENTTNTGTKQYRAAIIGCGNRAGDHARAYELIDNAMCVACCAPTPTRREQMAEEMGLKAYEDARKMIEVEKPDIVHVVTWPDYRVEPLRLVSEMGVPLCTVEKPLCTGVTDWQTLSELEASSKTRFAVCHQTRWNAQLEACREAMRSGKLGQPRLVHFSAGMNISGQGTHALNYGLSLVGDPDVTEVFGSASGWDARDTRHPAPETTVAQLTLENGIKGLWTSGRVSPRCGDIEATHQHVRGGAYFSNGRIEWQQFGKWEIVIGDDVQSGMCRESAEQFAANWIWEQAEFHKAMFKWLEGDPPVGTNLKRSLHEWAVVLALYQSSLERRPIELNTFDPPADLVERIRR